MATKPTKTEKQYYDEAYAQNKGIVDQQYAERQKTTQDSINQYGSTVDNQVNTTAGEYQKQIDSAPGKYQSLYNENAIREIAARANLQEQIANAGIVDSGLNRTQMTSLANQKGNADAAVSQQKQEYINQLSDAILKVKAEGEANKAGYANQMNTADAQWYRDAILGAHTTAQDTAQKQVQADWENYIAQQKAEQEAIEKQRDYEMQMLKLGYVRGNDGNWYKDTSASSSDQLALLKAINGQANTNQKDFGMNGDIAAASARIAYGAGTASDYAIVGANKEGYTGDAANAYIQAALSGQDPNAAADAVIMNTAKSIAGTVSGKDITGVKTLLSSASNDGKIVANKVKAQIGDKTIAILSPLEYNATVALAVGKAVKEAWGDDKNNETRIKSALEELGVDSNEYYAPAVKYAEEFKKYIVPVSMSLPGSDKKAQALQGRPY